MHSPMNTKCSSSGRRMTVQVLTSLPNTFFHLQNCSYLSHVNKLCHICTYKFLPDDEPSGSKHVQDIVKIKMLVEQRFIVLAYIIRLYHSERHKTIKEVIHIITTVSSVCKIYSMNNAVYKCLALFVVLYSSINTEFSIHFLNLYCFPQSDTLTHWGRGFKLFKCTFPWFKL